MSNTIEHSLLGPLVGRSGAVSSETKVEVSQSDQQDAMWAIEFKNICKSFGALRVLVDAKKLR
jgi:hypothetical protein